MKFTFFDEFSKHVKISNFIEILPFGGELFHADGQADGQTYVTKLILAFPNFANVSEGLIEFEEMECLQGQNTTIFFQRILRYHKLTDQKQRPIGNPFLRPCVNLYDIVNSVHMPLRSLQIQTVPASAVTDLIHARTPIHVTKRHFLTE